MIIMGKLASLAKEIEKNPTRWYYPMSMRTSIYGKRAYGAYQNSDGKWCPITWKVHDRNPHSYIMFVRFELDLLGIKTDHPRNKRGHCC
jgi:hypothetical protein